MKKDKQWIAFNTKTGRAYLESEFVLNRFTGLMAYSTLPLGNDPQLYKDLIVKDKLEVKYVSV